MDVLGALVRTAVHHLHAPYSVTETVTEIVIMIILKTDWFLSISGYQRTAGLSDFYDF